MQVLEKLLLLFNCRARMEGDIPVYRLRWFTPEIEMDLCGHATLATAHIILTEYEPASSVVRFESEFNPDGLEVAEAAKDRYRMRLPNRPPRTREQFTLQENIFLQTVLRGMGKPEPKQVFKSRDFLLLYDSQVSTLRSTLTLQ